MRKRLCAAIVVSGALTATTAGLLGTAAQANSGPSSPPGISADGSVDPTRAARTVPLVGVDGKPVTDASGRVRQVQTGFGVPPPPPGRGQADGLLHKLVADGEGRTVEKVEIPPLRP